MTDITIRNIPEEIASALEARAKALGLARETFLRQKLTELAQAEIEIRPRWGAGIKAFTPTGGHATLKNLSESIQSGARDLSQEEFAAYERAKLLADPRNGGRWAEARKLLEDAGFEVFNV